MDVAGVRAIFEDSEGNFWFGNNGSGLFKFDGKQLTNITKTFHLENEMFVLSGLSKSVHGQGYICY